MPPVAALIIMTYAEKLKDPRWQKMRLKILERDEWTCQICGNKEETLHVHHKRYLRGKEPWDCPDIFLSTLCAPCHELEGIEVDGSCEDLLGFIKMNFFSNGIDEIADGFYGLKLFHSQEVVASALRWFLRDDKAQRKLIEAYLDNIKKDPEKKD